MNGPIEEMHLSSEVERKEPKSAPGERGVTGREGAEPVEHEVRVDVG